MRFIRFVVAAPDPSSQVRQGVFQAAAELRDEAGLSEAEQELLRDALAWFARNLPEPRRFSEDAYYQVVAEPFAETET